MIQNVFGLLAQMLLSDGVAFLGIADEKVSELDKVSRRKLTTIYMRINGTGVIMTCDA